MADFHDILLDSHHLKQKGTVIPITVFMPDTFIKHKFQVCLCQKTVIFESITNQKAFILNPKSKMEPKYHSDLQGNQVLQKIRVVLMNEEMSLECQDKQKLTQIYARLKNIISHKGFNEYFKPIKRLGKGAFATVYLIQHKITKQRWAAKVFSRQGQKLEFKGQQALENQIRTLRCLSHPNIIKYQGVYETESLIYLVSEYLSGGTLDELMRNKANLKSDTVITILKQTLEALAYLKVNNIMHRDLKPENILLRQADSKWVLADFGLSAFTKEDHIYDKCGTMGYMAPEILSQNIEERELSKAFSSACDLYSLGIIAYNLIVGSLPFKVQAEGMFNKKIIWDAWKKTQCQELHPQIIKFLRGLLQSNPSKRWNSEQAIASPFFNNKDVISSWRQYNQKRIDQRFEKILKMANIN